MAAPTRPPLRSSARISNGGTGGSGGGGGGGGGSADPARRQRDASAAAAAAQRRARAQQRALEVEDSPRELRDKCRRLARALRNAKHLVVYTGAGISTAADIPDYRGPRGVWTRLQRGETVGRVEVSRARPTYTHMALTALWARGLLKFVVSQNCDGLHLRSGLPRRALAELHGDMFAERCGACRRVYLRAFDTTERTARHAHGTRRLCHTCGAELADTIVHFGERGRAAWPLNWAGALRHAAAADVVLCLGSSLKVLRRYPRLWRMQSAPHARPDLYIVNLQWTPKDAVAKMKINARCDAVMAEVARRLRLRVPRYRARRDPLLAHAEPLAAAEAHTTRRPLLPAPPPAGTDSESDSDSASDLSASESDDELPLRRLAERLRRPEPPPEPPPPPAPPAPPPAPVSPPRVAPARRPSAPSTLPPVPPLLHAFQVSMNSGDATILLRSEHAPSAGAGPPAPASPGPRPLSDLRRFRMARAALNGRAPAPRRPHPADPGGEDADMAEVKENGVHVKEEKIEIKEEKPDRKEDADDIKENGLPHKTEAPEPKEEEEGARREAVAAAIIARAVLLCRASLYPGLHTIIPGAAPACAWCWRAAGARRCLWYPALRTPPERRARRRGRLCACCGAAPEPDRDTGGWYGKGYRKGRRRRR